MLGVVVVLAGAGGVAAGRWWHGRPPYGPGALRARATLQLVDQATANAALRPVTAAMAGPGDQIFLGRVSWVEPPRPRKNNSLWIVVLDKRNHAMPGFIAAKSSRPDDVSTGSDPSLDRAEKRYPWLQGIGAREVNGSYWTSGSAISVSAMSASPVTFQFVLHPDDRETPGPAAVADLLIALISVGPDGQVYWADRLLN